MNANYVIESNDGRFFGGWNRLGNIVMKRQDERGLAYRMSRTVAARNLYKVEEFTGMKCTVVQA